jgi:1-acyl-sn-glycerol-3-phosphate acyltransferase
MVYSFVVWILWIVESIFLGTIATLLGFLDHSGRLSHLVGRLWGKCIIFSSGIDVEVTGLENIIKDKPQIFISNHQGIFDIFSINAFFPVQLRWIAKKELFWTPFIGWSMKAARYISIDRMRKKSALRSLKRSIRAINKGFSIVIFPEGTRSLDGKLLPFLRGSLILINKTNAPVVPVTISGSHKVIKKDEFGIHKCTIKVKIDKPIYTDSISDEEKETLLEKIKSIIQKNLDEMTGKQDEDQRDNRT